MEKTKKEEYDALRAIEEILKDFSPEETYIGKAFEGCIEQADENIRHEWMHSWKERYDITFRNLNTREADLVELTKQLNLEDDAIARLTDAKNQLSKEISRMAGMLGEKDAAYDGLEDKLEEAQRQIGTLKQTILELKAKLYDMMTREEVKA